MAKASLDKLWKVSTHFPIKVLNSNNLFWIEFMQTNVGCFVPDIFYLQTHFVFLLRPSLTTTKYSAPNKLHLSLSFFPHQFSPKTAFSYLPKINDSLSFWMQNESHFELASPNATTEKTPRDEIKSIYLVVTHGPNVPWISSNSRVNQPHVVRCCAQRDFSISPLILPIWIIRCYCKSAWFVWLYRCGIFDLCKRIQSLEKNGFKKVDIVL